MRGQPIFAVLAIFSLGGFASASASNLIVNGSLTGPTVVHDTPPSWSNLGGTPDTVEPDYVRTGGFIYAVGSPFSPDGGTFVNAFNNEAFGQTILSLQPDTEYTLSFYQSNSGLYLGATPHGIRDGRWEVSLDGVSQFSPTMAFAGNGNQTWELVEMIFTTGASISFQE